MGTSLGDITPEMMRPSGWFQVGWSSDFSAGEVASRRFLGQDVVLWRRSDGELVAMDAYCGHMGAHLGQAELCGDRVACPFHGWEWDTEGRNTSIPYQDRPNRAVRMRTYPITERSGVAYLWHDPDDAEPSWSVPDAVTTFDEDVADGNAFHPCHPHGQIDYGVRSLDPYVVMDNAADAAHFTFVHGAPEIPHVVHAEPDGFLYRVRLGFGDVWREAPEEALGMRLDIHQAGVGLAFTAFGGGGVPWLLILLGVTPVDESTSVVFQTIWLQELPGDENDGRIRERIDRASFQLPHDIAIWENQRYVERPAWAASEVRGFQALRRWAKQFYEPSSTESQTAVSEPMSTGAS